MSLQQRDKLMNPNPTLGELAAAKKVGAEKSPVSVGEAERAVSFVEFRPDPRAPLLRSGFPMAQLCHYTLEPNDGGNRDAAPERLTFAFSTADVVLTGVRLAALLPLLNQHKLEWVAAVDPRYANVDSRPWVAEIAVGHLGKATG